MRQHVELDDIVKPEVENLGFEFVGLQMVTSGRLVIRVYADKSGGIEVRDCQQISRQLDVVLQVKAKFLPESFTLEVSSPGVDRLLFTQEQLVQFIGRDVTIKLYHKLDGRGKFTGKLQAVADEVALTVEDNQQYSFGWDNIAEARLVPEF